MKKAFFPSSIICFFTAVLIPCATTVAQRFGEPGLVALQNLRESTNKTVSERKNSFTNMENVLNREDLVKKEISTDLVNSINPDEYYTGGGDMFSISLIGLPAIRYVETINQQGDLYIPELGLLQLGKITLTEAQRKINEFIREKLKKQNQIYIQFLKAKTATITINGAVQEPGTYVLSGGDRVLDAIRKANGGTLPSINDCNYREIACKNRDSIKKIDMFNYLLKNDFSGNPYLYPGDNISLLYATKRVLLNTLAKSGVSGWIPIKENETLGEFLSFHRLDCSVDTTIIYYQSLGEKANRFIKAISWSDAGTVVLQDKDVITIPGKENYSPVYMVTIGGEVARPGTYSIIRNNTTAEEIISNAGGPTARANIDAAVIIRFRKVEDGQQSRGKEKTLQTTDIRPEMRAGLEKMANMSDFSIMELNRVGTKTLLQEDDRIYFPPKETVVYISGNVKLPGAYPYVAGKDLKYYIQGAGGYTSKASKTNTFGIRYYERVSQQTDLREIKEGDIIIVPESQQGKTLSTVILPILSIVFGTVGTALTIISIAMQ